MKKIQIKRLIVQLLSIILIIYGIYNSLPFIMTLIIATTFLFGPFHCGWICPLGTLQDFSSKLGTILNIKKRKPPMSIKKYLITLRYILLLIFLIFTSDFIFSIISFDPRANLLIFLEGRGLIITNIIIIFSTLILSIFYERIFCNYLCIEGAKYGFASFFRLFTITRNEELCIDCKKCDNICPMNIKISTKENLTTTQCINCFKCQSICPIPNAITYNKTNYKNRFNIKNIIIIIFFASILIFSQLKDQTSEKASSNKKNDLVNDKNTISSENITSNEELNKSSLKDGTYTGKGKGFKSTITVEVVVKNNKIHSIEVVDHNDDAKWFNRANNVIPNDIINSQSTEVDTVSGATYSSLGIINAVKDALN